MKSQRMVSLVSGTGILSAHMAENLQRIRLHNSIILISLPSSQTFAREMKRKTPIRLTTTMIIDEPLLHVPVPLTEWTTQHCPCLQLNRPYRSDRLIVFLFV